MEFADRKRTDLEERAEYLRDVFERDTGWSSEEEYRRALDDAVMSVCGELRRRPTLLQEAERTVYGDREDSYGDPGENLARIADMWEAYLDTPVNARDVALMMVMVKISRDVESQQRDNLLDAAGYLECADRLEHDTEE